MNEHHCPPLPQLSVIRDTYCSQSTTDTAFEYLWKHKPDLVLKQIEWENNFCQEYLMQLASIVEFFRYEAVNDIDIPDSRLGMLDLLFELSRRLRIIKGLPEWEIIGEPLAESPEGPFPELPSLPIQSRQISQEQADRIIAEAYKKRPDLFYDFVEGLRRGSPWPWDIFNELKSTLITVSLPADEIGPSEAFALGGEINRRLRVVSGLPKAPGDTTPSGRYDTLKRWANRLKRWANRP